jgi:uncharacterized protein YjbI with pentapeptide repeats/beta-lactamase regulating signal transducer with metallopeptidase domain
MLEAIVNVALRAILASVLLGGVLVLAVLAATRWLSLTASTRHALWTIALIATALMPLAGVGVSLARGMAPKPAGVAATPTLFDPLPARVTGSGAHSGPGGEASSHASATAPRPAGLRFPNLSFNFTPRLSRELALGVVGVWLVGALIGLVGLFASIVRVRGLKKRSSPLEGDLADELPWLTDVAAGREIYLRLSFETETPVAIGFRRPVILIPTELASADGLAAIESLILHEHAHLRRYDDWTNLVQRTIERLFWFNPVVWLVGRRIALEREIASDDAVVEKTGAAHEYATSLWRLAREMRMPEHAVVAPGALLTRKQISVRIELLLDKNRARLHRSPAASFGVVLAGLLAVGFVATSAPAVELPAAAPVAAGPRAIAPDVSKLHHERIVIVHRMRPAAPAAHATPSQRVRILAGPPVMPPSVPLRVVPPLPHVAPLSRVAPIPSTPPIASMPPMPHVRVDVDVAAIVRDALADVPMQIAQGEAGMHGGRSLSGVKLSRALIASCKGCSMRNADMRGLDLHGLALTGANMSGADLRGANLAGAVLIGVSLARANLSTADLRGAVLTGVELSGANFAGALLDDVRLNGVSFRRVSLRGTALRGVVANCSGCDFSGMDLRGQDLHGITLTGANLSRADLRDANLANVRLNGVDFSHANLAGADLTGASLSGCDLAGVNLQGAKTAGMTLHGTGLDG